MRRGRLLLLGLGAPALVLVAAFGWLAVHHETLALWGVPVHESGRHTLGETVLYYAHFLRELPIDLAIALFAAAAVDSAIGRDGAPGCTLRDRRITLRVAIGIAVFLPSVAFALAAAAHGPRSALCDLLQCRIRDDVTGYGTHWHYHLLSTLWIALAAPIAVRILLALSGTSAPTARTRRSPIRVVAWGYFAAMSIVFGMSAEAFTSVRYAGHQARELATHGAITLPVTIALLLTMVTTGQRHQSAGSLFGGGVALMRGHGAGVVLAVAIAVYLAVVALSGNIMVEGQSRNGLAAMVGAHLFEHALDYALIPAVAVIALVVGRRSARPGEG